MDDMRKRILAAAADKGLDLKEISFRIGKNHAYMQQFIHRNTPQKLKEEDRRIVSQLLGIPETELGAPVGFTMNGSNKGLPPDAPNATVTGKPRETGVRVPLYGSAVGGIDGQFELNGNVLDTVVAPPSLEKVRGSYAVRVAGESMEPRYEDGETVFIDPTRRPTRNDYVVAQIRKDDHGAPLAYVKKFVRRNDQELVLSQFNPPKELRFENCEVESVHYILRSGE